MGLEELMRVKVMNYNILHGFHSPDVPPYNPPYVLQEDRLKAAQEIVKAENPDILVLTEAAFGGDGFEGIKIDYPALFGFPHSYHAVSHRQWGYAILSKYPIMHAEKDIQSKRPFVRTQLDLNGQSITVDIAHPHPSLSEEEKREYFRNALERERLTGPHILAGDFNTVSSEDRYDREKMIPAFRSFAGENAEKEVDDGLKALAVRYILSQGLMDTYKAIHPVAFDYTIPTDILSLDKDSGRRMDFIFCSGDFTVRDAYVINNNLTNKASDHHPVVAVLEFPGN